VVVGPEADLTGEHEQVLIFVRVPMRRCDGADRERMFDNRHQPSSGAAGRV
jgi:hypothetical protein